MLNQQKQREWEIWWCLRHDHGDEGPFNKYENCPVCELERKRKKTVPDKRSDDET